MTDRILIYGQVVRFLQELIRDTKVDYEAKNQDESDKRFHYGTYMQARRTLEIFEDKDMFEYIINERPQIRREME